MEDHVHEDISQTKGLAASVLGEPRGIRGKTWTHIEALMESHRAPQEDGIAEQNVRRRPLGPHQNVFQSAMPLSMGHAA